MMLGRMMLSRMRRKKLDQARETDARQDAERKLEKKLDDATENDARVHDENIENLKKLDEEKKLDQAREEDAREDVAKHEKKTGA